MSDTLDRLHRLALADTRVRIARTLAVLDDELTTLRRLEAGERVEDRRERVRGEGELAGRGGRSEAGSCVSSNS